MLSSAGSILVSLRSCLLSGVPSTPLKVCDLGMSEFLSSTMDSWLAIMLKALMLSDDS